MSPPPDSARCAGCDFFGGRAFELEAQFPGLRSLSSAYASVRSEDGLCAHHERYVAASSFCAAYRRRAAAQPV